MLKYLVALLLCVLAPNAQAMDKVYKKPKSCRFWPWAVAGLALTSPFLYAYVPAIGCAGSDVRNPPGLPAASALVRANEYALASKAGDFLGAAPVVALPAEVQGDFAWAQEAFAKFRSDDDTEAGLVSLHQDLLALLKARKKQNMAPELLQAYVIAPLYASLLQDLDQRDYLPGVDFLSWYVPSFAAQDLPEGYGRPDQRVFALFSHLAVLSAQDGLAPGSEFTQQDWERLLNTFGEQRRLLAWLTGSERENDFGKVRYHGAIPNSLWGADVVTPLASYPDWQQSLRQRRQAFLQNREHLQAQPILRQNEWELQAQTAYFAEGLAWVAKEGEPENYFAITVDDFAAEALPIEGTLIEFAGDEPVYWRHGTPNLWRQRAYERFVAVLSAADGDDEQLNTRLGQLFYTAAQYTRWLRGSAAINGWSDVLLRLRKGVAVPPARRNLDCYALSMNGREFLSTVYLKR